MVCTSDFDPKTLTSGRLFPSEHNSRYFNKKARPAGLVQVGRVDAAPDPDRRVPLRRLWELNARLGTGNFGCGHGCLTHGALPGHLGWGMAGAVQAGQRAAEPAR
jgi:hypothetical protein